MKRKRTISAAVRGRRHAARDAHGRFASTGGRKRKSKRGRK